MPEPVRLLIVCLGNICRSPMAEGALRARLREAGLADAVHVDSAGTGGWHAGQPPDPRAIACASRHGVELGQLRARQLRPGDFSGFDWILCADQENLRDVRALGPASARARAALLLPWAGHAGDAIPDPYEGGAPDFEHVWRLVDAAARTAVRERRWERGADA